MFLRKISNLKDEENDSTRDKVKVCVGRNLKETTGTSKCIRRAFTEEIQFNAVFGQIAYYLKTSLVDRIRHHNRIFFQNINFKNQPRDFSESHPNK